MYLCSSSQIQLSQQSVFVRFLLFPQRPHLGFSMAFPALGFVGFINAPINLYPPAYLVAAGLPAKASHWLLSPVCQI